MTNRFLTAAMIFAMMLCAVSAAGQSPADPVPADADGSVPSAVAASEACRPGDIPAFPGAEGGGMYTTGGRGGRVLYVTRLDDDGREGSLRWALSQKYPRIIMFTVSGVIRLASRLRIEHDNVTIAGQSAPGDGICIRDYDVLINADNVIIRHLRFRMGDGRGVEGDALGGVRCRNIMIDHCSVSWATDECASFYSNINFTMQWCFVTESLRISSHSKGEHGYGGIWGGNNASFHHNLLACHDSRNPRFDHNFIYKDEYPIAGYRGNVDFRNNVIYNWGANNTYGGEGGRFNMVGNYYKRGPASSDRRYFIESYGMLIDLSYMRDNSLHDVGHPRLYMEGNYYEGDPDGINEDNTKGVSRRDDGGGTAGMFLSSPLKINGLSAGHTTTQTAREAFRAVLERGGAWPRDAVDARIAADAANGSASVMNGGRGSRGGLIDTPSAVGGWPVYNTSAAPADTDGDGMPDLWEKANGLDPSAPEDGKLYTLDGRYTNVEVYLNSLGNNTP